MTAYTRKTNTEWMWQEGDTTRSVRYFPETDALIWSGWQDRAHGPVFRSGYRQTRSAFLQKGIERVTPPPALMNELRQYLESIDEDNAPQRGLFAFLRRR